MPPPLLGIDKGVNATDFGSGSAAIATAFWVPLQGRLLSRQPRRLGRLVRDTVLSVVRGATMGLFAALLGNSF